MSGSTSRSIRSRAGQLAARAVPLHRLGAAAAGDVRRPPAQLGDELGHPRLPAGELLRAGVDLGGEDGHERSLTRRPGVNLAAAHPTTPLSRPSVEGVLPVIDAIDSPSLLAGAPAAGLPSPAEFRRAVLGAAADALGLNVQRVQLAFRHGLSLADLAEERDVPKSGLVRAVARGDREPERADRRPSRRARSGRDGEADRRPPGRPAGQAPPARRRARTPSAIPPGARRRSRSSRACSG